jgi:hypothetical protein
VADLTSKLRSAQAEAQVGQLVGTWWDLLEPDISLQVLGLQTWTLACLPRHALNPCWDVTAPAAAGIFCLPQAGASGLLSLRSQVMGKDENLEALTAQLCVYVEWSALML